MSAFKYSCVGSGICFPDADGLIYSEASGGRGIRIMRCWAEKNGKREHRRSARRDDGRPSPMPTRIPESTSGRRSSLHPREPRPAVRMPLGKANDMLRFGDARANSARFSSHTAHPRQSSGAVARRRLQRPFRDMASADRGTHAGGSPKWKYHMQAIAQFEGNAHVITNRCAWIAEGVFPG
jgi:hypothetical protein